MTIEHFDDDEKFHFVVFPHPPSSLMTIVEERREETRGERNRK
jgi:hypothetical protein